VDVVLGDPARTPIATFPWTSNTAAGNAGQIKVNNPVPNRPPVPLLQGVASIAGNVVTVRGRGRAGLEAVLTTGRNSIGNSTVEGDGRFLVLSKRLGSGTWVLRLAQVDNRGAESEAISSGTVFVVAAPTVIAVNVESGAVKMVERGVPGAKIALVIVSKRRTAGRDELSGVIADQSGNFSISSSVLAAGIYELRITQQDGSSASDPTIIGPVTISDTGVRTTAAIRPTTRPVAEPEPRSVTTNTGKLSPVRETENPSSTSEVTATATPSRSGSSIRAPRPRNRRLRARSAPRPHNRRLRAR